MKVRIHYLLDGVKKIIAKDLADQKAFEDFLSKKRVSCLLTLPNDDSDQEEIETWADLDNYVNRGLGVEVELGPNLPQGTGDLLGLIQQQQSQLDRIRQMLEATLKPSPPSAVPPPRPHKQSQKQQRAGYPYESTPPVQTPKSNSPPKGDSPPNKAKASSDPPKGDSPPYKAKSSEGEEEGKFAQGKPEGEGGKDSEEDPIAMQLQLAVDQGHPILGAPPPAVVSHSSTSRPPDNGSSSSDTEAAPLSSPPRHAMIGSDSGVSSVDRPIGYASDDRRAPRASDSGVSGGESPINYASDAPAHLPHLPLAPSGNEADEGSPRHLAELEGIQTGDGGEETDTPAAPPPDSDFDPDELARARQ